MPTCFCQVMVGRVRLHKLQQQKETKLIIEEVEIDLVGHMTIYCRLAFITS